MMEGQQSVPPEPPGPTPRDLLEYIPIGHPDSMMSNESVRKAVEEFCTKPSDVIVATFPKTGTTLVTWICHLLRTGASEKSSLSGFETLYEVVPWPMLSWDIGYDPNESDFEPRVYKSHLRMASIYPGCKYVVTIRDPAKTALSFYNFFIAKRVPFLVAPTSEDDDSSNENNTRLLMDVSTFLVNTPFVKGSPKTPSSELRASIWEYYAEYHALLESPSVLMLIYEDLVADMSSSTRALAKFLGLENHSDNELIERTVAMSTKEYMARHMSKFDEPYERAKALARAADISQLAPGAKVAVQKHTQTFDDRANAFLDEQWRSSMEPLGYPDYASFCTTVRAVNQIRWFDH